MKLNFFIRPSSTSSICDTRREVKVQSPIAVGGADLVLSRAVDLLGHAHELGGIVFAVGAREASLLRLEPVQGLEGHVQLTGTIKLGKVGDEELWLREGG